MGLASLPWKDEREVMRKAETLWLGPTQLGLSGVHTVSNEVNIVRH